MLENLQQLIQASMALESGAGSVFDFTEQQGPGSSCLSLSYQEHLILFGEFVDDIRTGYLSRTDARSILAQARAVVLDEQDLVSESCALDFAYAEVGQRWVRNCERLLTAYSQLLTYLDSGQEKILPSVLSAVSQVFEEKSLLFDGLPADLISALEPGIAAKTPEQASFELKTFFSNEPSQSYESFLNALWLALEKPDQGKLEAHCQHFSQVLASDQALLESRLQRSIEPTSQVGKVWFEQTAEFQEILRELSFCGDRAEGDEIFLDLEALTEERISLHFEMMNW